MEKYLLSDLSALESSFLRFGHLGNRQKANSEDYLKLGKYFAKQGKTAIHL
jgi:hypothetical protein